MVDVDTIRWLRLTDADVASLHAGVAAAVASLPEVVAAYHYGSSARRQPARDIDIGIVVDHAARSAVDVEAIAGRIATATGRDIDELDVRVVNDADAVFLGNLMREGVRCHQRDVDSRVAFEVRALNAWLDFRPAWERMRTRVLARWARG